MEYVYSLIAGAIALYLASLFLDGVKVRGLVHAAIVVIVIAILNFTVGTVLKILTLGILSWGIFAWLLDAIIIQVADYFLDRFEVKNFWWALALAAMTSIIDCILRSVF